MPPFAGIGRYGRIERRRREMGRTEQCANRSPFDVVAEPFSI
jgi:hypothetical protein